MLTTQTLSKADISQPVIGHVIHDPKREDRIKTLLHESGQQRLPMRFFPSVKAETTIAGISRAHKQVVRYAMEKQMPEVLILEDDVRFCGPGALQYFLGNKPADYDLYLSGIYFGQIRPDNTVKQFSGLHCYMVHHRFYRTFLEADETKHLDMALTGLGVYKVCNPFAAIQYNGYSDNTQRMANYDELLKDRQLYNQFDLCTPPILKSPPMKTENGT